MDVSKDYYKILSVNKNAPKKEIRASYLKLAKQWHPDLHQKPDDKKKAREKFIEFQEAYEVLHDDGMRKKYDEMRRYGMSQDQYKYHEAYQRQTGQSPQYTDRRASPYENMWEDQFRRNMQQEWEKIRREQRDWASARRAERHQYGDEFGQGQNPFGQGQNPFGQGQNPFGQGFNWNDFQSKDNKMVHPFEGLFRTMIYVFAFFMMLRIIGFMLFGPNERRRGNTYDPYDRHGPAGRQSPFYGPSDYNKYNHGMPGPFSLEKKKSSYKNIRDIDEYDDDRNILKRRQPYRPPAPNMRSNNKGPRPKNTLNDNRERNNDVIINEDDGNEYKFSNPNMELSNAKQRRKVANAKKKKSKYEKMLEEQKMMEEVYIRARRKQMEEKEFRRQTEMNKKYGRRPIQTNNNNNDKEDVNDAWERYLNSNSKRGTNWRDRGRRTG